MAVNLTSETILPLVPECSALSVQDFTAAGADSFRLDEVNYFKDHIPSMIPGIVLGGIAFFFFIAFSIWSMINFCSCCWRICNKSDAETSGDTISIDDALQSGQYSQQSAFPESPQRKRISGVKIMQILIVVFMLATLGASGWGIYETIDKTDSQISAFWDIIASVKFITTDASGILQRIASFAETLLGYVDQAIPGIPDAGVASTGREIAGTLQDIRDEIDQSVLNVNEDIERILTNIQNDFEPPSKTFDSNWRVATIVLLYCFVIFSALLSGLLSLKLKWRGWTCLSIVFLWFFIMLLMIFGPGLLRGVHEIAHDACLFSETFVLRYAGKKFGDNSEQKQIFQRVLVYFINSEDAKNEPIGSALSQLLGTNVEELNDQISDFVSQIPGNNLDLSGPQETFWNEVHGASRDIYIALTVIGSLAIVLATLCSARIIQGSIKARRKRSTEFPDVQQDVSEVTKV